jgi:hypothetical protein
MANTTFETETAYILSEVAEAELINLITAVKEFNIWTEDTNDDGEVYEYQELTIGYDVNSWNYQTGDNSYFGGAYRYSNPWLVTQLYPHSDPAKVVAELLSQVYNFMW